MMYIVIVLWCIIFLSYDKYEFYITYDFIYSYLKF